MTRSAPDPGFELDDLNRKIVQLLRSNGRLSNREIGRQLGVSEGTIRKRLRQLIESGIIQIVAFANLYQLGYRSEFILGLDCDLDQIEQATEALAALEEVRYVSVLTGSFDILVAILLESPDHLLEFLTKRVGAIPGIRKSWTAQSLRIVKRNYELLPGEVRP